MYPCTVHTRDVLISIFVPNPNPDFLVLNISQSRVLIQFLGLQIQTLLKRQKSEAAQLFCVSTTVISTE